MSKSKRIKAVLAVAGLVITGFAFNAVAKDVPPKPVKVFILAGQSNMQGKGSVAVMNLQAQGSKTKDFFKHLRKDGKWIVRKDVFIKYLERHGPLTVGYGSPGSTGTELEFGMMMGDHFEEPVILIKAAWGGHSLFKLFRSPSAGYPASIQQELEDARSKVEASNKKNKKSDPLPTMDDIKMGYGSSYRNMMAEVKETFDNYRTMFPELKNCTPELAGFFWFQGYNDMFGDLKNPSSPSNEYASNMKHFIKDVRKDLGVPKLPFVIAAIGNNGSTVAQGGMLAVQSTQMAMNDVPEFKGNVKAFRVDVLVDKAAEELYPTRQQNKEEWKRVGSSAAYHYFGSPIWYTRIGRAAGDTMLAMPADPARRYPEILVKPVSYPAGGHAEFLIKEGSGPEGAMVPGKALAAALKILNNSDSSFWEIDGALKALGMAEMAGATAKNLNFVRNHLGHEDWWVRAAAWRSIGPLIDGLTAKNIGSMRKYLTHENRSVKAAAWQAIGPLFKDDKRIEPLLAVVFDSLAGDPRTVPLSYYLGYMQELLKDENMSSGIKQKAIAGMLQVLHDAVIAPANQGKVGGVNKYDLKSFCSSVPGEDDEPDYMGVIEYIRKLPAAQRDPLLIRSKQLIAELEAQKQLALSKGDKGAARAPDKALATISLAIAPWQTIVSTSRTTPQPWRYLMWNADSKSPLDKSGNMRLPDAPPPAGMKEWFGHDFDDSKWKEGNAIFGIWKEARGWLGDKTISTEWSSDYIFLRKSFQLEDVQMRYLRLNVLFRDATEVYLNGEKIYTNHASVGFPVYQTIDLDPKILRKGVNTVAVQSRVNYWRKTRYGLVDVGLRGAREMQ